MVSIFFVVALSTMGGVLALDPIFTDVARNFGGTRWTLFRTVALPGATPAIFTGLRLALGFALIVVVGTEFGRPPEFDGRGGRGHVAGQAGGAGAARSITPRSSVCPDWIATWLLASARTVNWPAPSVVAASMLE